MKFDIIMPVYNTRPDHLLEAVYSILNQTHQQFRLLIVDDGSENPHTLAALQIARSLDKRIELHSIVHAGTPTAINHGHKLASTEYIAIMGSDDISHPTRLELQSNHLKKYPETDVLGTGLISYHDKDPFRKPNIVLRRPAEIQASDNGFIVCHGTSVYRRSLALKVGGYDPALLRAQDINFFLRMKNAGAVISNLQDILYHWRRH